MSYLHLCTLKCNLGSTVDFDFCTYDTFSKYGDTLWVIYESQGVNNISFYRQNVDNQLLNKYLEHIM